MITGRHHYVTQVGTYVCKNKAVTIYNNYLTFIKYVTYIKKTFVKSYDSGC